ncbi:MAG: AtpZ/AtpI family protein [Gemmataceae bacterium]|nr:AtpZ/AtpI family protein [Gemmataceae bacterium]
MSSDPGPTFGGDYRALGLVLTAVGEMVAPILIGVWLDDRYGWSPWGLVIGGTLGLVGGVGHLIVIARRESARKK